MLLHDNFFFSINETSHEPLVISYSILFHSTWTLIISLIGCLTNGISLIKLFFLIKSYRHRKRLSRRQSSISGPILAHRKYHFLFILILNNFSLSILSLISCLDEKFFNQSLIARFHLCSTHIFFWKFSLHFLPLLTIFVLFRYHYKFHKRFPLKHYNTTTWNQLFCTDLCILIPFVLALAWSVDGFWLWGEAKMIDFAPVFLREHNSTNSSNNIDRFETKLKEFYQNKQFHRSDQEFICYLRINDNLDFTARLLDLIQMDYVLVFVLHCFGLFLEFFLHIRLCCCLIARKITSAFLREQQLSLYILYFFFSFTLTAIPFYFYRVSEILFDSHLSFYYHELINSSTFAQILLVGLSVQPVLYALLFLPARFLFHWKCYTSIRLVNEQSTENDLFLSLSPRKSRVQHYSFHFGSIYPRFHWNLHTNSHQNILVPTNENLSLKSSMMLDVVQQAIVTDCS